MCRDNTRGCTIANALVPATCPSPVLEVAAHRVGRLPQDSRSASKSPYSPSPPFRCGSRGTCNRRPTRSFPVRNLHFPSMRLCRRHHRAAFRDGDRRRFLNVDMLPSLAGMYRLHGMPVIGRGDHDGIDVLAQTDVTIVAIGRHTHAGGVHGLGQLPLVDIAHGRDVHTTLRTEFGHPLQMTAAHATNADVGDRESIIGAGPSPQREDRGRHEVGGCQHSSTCRQEPTSWYTKFALSSFRFLCRSRPLVWKDRA